MVLNLGKRSPLSSSCIVSKQTHLKPLYGRKMPITYAKCDVKFTLWVLEEHSVCSIRKEAHLQTCHLGQRFCSFEENIICNGAGLCEYRRKSNCWEDICIVGLQSHHSPIILFKSLKNRGLWTAMSLRQKVVICFKHS